MHASRTEGARAKAALRVAVLVAMASLARRSAAGEAGPGRAVVAAAAELGEARRLFDEGLHARAAEVARRACEQREGALGAGPALAEALNVLGDAQAAAGDFGGAERSLRRALALREAALGPSSAEAGESLHSLGSLYFLQGFHARAQRYLERALAIRQEALGPDAPEVARTLHNLAGVFASLELYGHAEPLLERERSIWSSAPGDRRPEIAFALAALGNLYRRQGSPDRALPLLERALALRIAALGPGHLDVARSLFGLATAERDRGRFEDARQRHREAMAVYRAAVGARHIETGKVVYALAEVDWLDHRYGAAVEGFRQALEIREEAVQDPRRFVAGTLSDRPAAYAAHGMYTRGEPVHDRGMAALSSGPTGNPLSDPLAFLAAWSLLGRTERLFLRAREIHEAALGRTHPLVAEDLYTLAGLALMQGQVDRAEPPLRRWLEIAEETLGPDHPYVAKTLFDLGRVMAARGRLDEALPLLERGLAISEQHLRAEALDFSGERMAGFLELFRDDEEVLLALLREHPGDPRVRRLALASALLLKGRSLDETAAVSRAITASLTPEDAKAMARLRAMRTELAEASLDGPGGASGEGRLARLEALAARCDALEDDLARRSAPLRALAALPPAGRIVEQVAGALPEGSALVEVVAHWARASVAAPRSAPGGGELRYLALVLLRDGSTGAVDLGPAEAIDAAAARLRAALARKDQGYLPVAQSLHAMAIRPLLPLLGGARHLLIAPDGQLGLVPFAALHDGRRFLADDFDVTYLTSGKDLLRRGRSRDAGPSSEIVVLADPDVGGAPQGHAAAPPLVVRGPSWDPLPGARVEGDAIRSLYPGRARVLVGTSATKEALLGLRAPAALVVITHAAWLDDGAPAERVRAVVMGPSSGAPPAPADPLLRSWLVMAGANEGQGPFGQGMVSALELAGMDLWGTQLVVLSACDSGLGEVRRGQGVYGLRRALFVAGAETVVMSLWQVNDDATSALMQRYWRNLAAGGGRTRSLRDAMLAVRAERPHPYYWAPFIAAGSDAPLAITPAAP